VIPQTILVGIAGLVLIAAALWDAFETVVLPRRVAGRLRIAGVFYRLTWGLYSRCSRFVHDTAREGFLSFYGPLSILLLVAVWALVLILGFACLNWASGSQVSTPGGPPDFGTDVYFSGTTFFTLGLGDILPIASVSRVLTVAEGGTGFAFLALVIGYVPIIYQMFARRETNVSLLDQRAGSPPSATEFIRRNVHNGDASDLERLLREWEVWVADLLESHLSYPPLAFFRSQHENQSWVGSLAVIMDVCAYVLACGSSRATRQAAFTFAVSRHAAGDLSNVFRVTPHAPHIDRVTPECDSRGLRAISGGSGRIFAHGFATLGPSTRRHRQLGNHRIGFPVARSAPGARVTFQSLARVSFHAQ
jgi:hypothetical protein